MRKIRKLSKFEQIGHPELDSGSINVSSSRKGKVLSNLIDSGSVPGVTSTPVILSRREQRIKAERIRLMRAPIAKNLKNVQSF